MEKSEVDLPIKNKKKKSEVVYSCLIELTLGG